VGIPERWLGRRIIGRRRRHAPMTAAVVALLAQFHPPTTKDFVWDCWGPSLNVGGLSFCMNFINLLVLLGFVSFIAFFYFGLRKPAVVPGKMQSLVEGGIQFVRENIAIPMLGSDSARFMPLLATFFFAIFFWNIFEVVPGVNFSSNSRIAFPLIMALVAWVTYNVIGVMKHGFLGYLKHVMVPPGAPAVLYVLLVPIEFLTQIIIRPITLSVRLWANFVAGHFLLAVFFLGTIAMLQGGFEAIFAPFSFTIAIVLVGFEIFVSGLQAFIFAILTASYIGGAMAEEH
jgi:F-type H+-transporting ATPase subunit a